MKKESKMEVGDKVIFEGSGVGIPLVVGKEYKITYVDKDWIKVDDIYDFWILASRFEKGNA